MKAFFAFFVLSLSVSLLGGCADLGKCGLTGCPEDKQLAAQVESAIRATPGLSYWDINVSVREQVVYLSGLADTNPERERAEHVARDVPGTKDVIDSIELRNTLGH